MLTEKGRKDEALRAIARKFTNWRAHRRKRGPIPPELLAEACALLKTHPLGHLARTLRINYNTLKKTSLSDQTGAGKGRDRLQGKREPFSAFVEIPAQSLIAARGERGSGKGVIEIETPRGYKIRLEAIHPPFDGTAEWLKRVMAACR